MEAKIQQRLIFRGQGFDSSMLHSLLRNLNFVRVRIFICQENSKKKNCLAD